MITHKQLPADLCVFKHTLKSRSTHHSIADGFVRVLVVVLVLSVAVVDLVIKLVGETHSTQRGRCDVTIPSQCATSENALAADAKRHGVMCVSAKARAGACVVAVPRKLFLPASEVL